MSGIRKSSALSKIFTSLLIFFAVTAAILAVTAASFPHGVYAAGGFGTAKYTSVGQTTLQTTYHGGSGTILGAVGLDGGSEKAADDFSFSGDLTQFSSANANNSVTFSVSGMAFSFTEGSGITSDGFYLQSAKSVQVGSTLFKAISDKSGKYDVRAELTANTQGSESLGSKIKPILTWNDGTGSLFSDDIGLVVAGNQVLLRSRSLSVGQNASVEPSLSVEFRFPKENGVTSVYASISDIRLTFIVTLKDASSISSDAVAQISGENRSPERDKVFNSADNAKHYVKSGDTVRVAISFMKGGKAFFLGEDFKDILGAAATSAVKWTASLKRNANDEGSVVVYDRLTFEAKETASEQSYIFSIPHIDDVYHGYVFVLKPSLSTNTSTEETLDTLKNISIILTVDVRRPEEPLLSANCDVAKYLEQLQSASQTYYWTNKKIGVSFTNQVAAGNSKEFLYYTVVRTNFSDNAETPTVNSNLMDSNTPQLNFFPNAADTKPGNFALALVFIDESGNVSSVKTFNKVFSVDDSDYSVSVRARLGATGGAEDASKKTDFGSFIFRGDTQDFVTGTMSFKRGQTVNLVYSFSDINLRNYYLASVYNQNGTPAFSLKPEDGDVVITRNEATKRTVYTISFQINNTGDVDYITSIGIRTFTFEFKYRAYPNIEGKTQMFEADQGSKINGIPQSGVARSLNVGTFYYYEENTKKTVIIGSDKYQVYYGKADAHGNVVYGPEFFALAGSYRYKIELFSDEKYYCIEEGDFVIQKAQPGISGLTVTSPKDESVGEPPDRRPSMQYGTPGGIGAFHIFSKDPDNGLSDTMTSIGLRGEFRIINMTPGTPSYDNPSVGAIDLIVVFTPQAKDSTNGVLNADNYAESTPVTVHVAVTKKNLNDTGDMVMLYSKDGTVASAVPLLDDTSIFYNGSFASLFLEIARLSSFGIGAADIIYEYSVSGGNYSPIPPIAAGRYTIRATISPAVANYTGVLEKSLEIKKQELEVRLLNAQNPNEFVYGYFERPGAVAGTKENFVPVSVSGFGYRYRAVGAESFEDTVPLNAGSYEAQISVLDANYGGLLVWVYRIRKVKNGDVGLTVNNPTPQTNSEIGAALRYGMPLSFLMKSATTGSVQYKKKDGKTMNVNGSFSPLPISVSQYGPDYVPSATEVMASPNYAFQFAFTPTEASEDALNFEVLTRASSVEILPAKINFDGVSLPVQSYGSNISTIIKATVGKATFRLFNPVAKTYSDVEIADGVFTYIGSDFILTDIPTVGDYSLQFRFTVPNQAALYQISEVTKKLSVVQNAQNVYIVAADGATEITVFTKTYGTADTVPTANIKMRSGLTGLEFVFRYFKKNVGGVLTEEISDIQTASVGSYFLEISIKDKNYSGVTVIAFSIEKFQLSQGSNTSQYPIAFQGLEWGNSTYLFQSGKDMGGTLYRDDITDQTLRRVAGTFSFVEDFTFDAAAAGVTKSLKIKFVPTDTANYIECVFDYGIVINKRTVTFQYNENSVYSAEEQSPSVTLYDGDAPISSENQKYTITFENGTPLGAGAYRGTVVVDADVAHYRGDTEILYTVAAQEIEIDIEIPTGGYFAGTAVMPEFNVRAKTGELAGTLGGEITVCFKDYKGNVLGIVVFDGTVPVFAPKNIGKYTVEITATGNHAGSVSAEFDLKPVMVGVNTVVVAYLQNSEQIAQITPILDNYIYHYSLYYKDSRGTEWKEEIPVDAGQYEVRVDLDECGYQNQYPLGIKYTVTQIEILDISAEHGLTFVYAVTEPNLEFAAFGIGEESERRLSYTLVFSDAQGNVLEKAPVHVGHYRVNVIINERNYSGQRNFEYDIFVGTALKNVGNVQMSPVAYKTDTHGGTDTMFTGRGTFRYIINGITAEITGVFTVVSENFTSFGVGTHVVTYEFAATSARIDGIDYTIETGDIAAFRDVVSVMITKKTLTREDFEIQSPSVVDGIAVTEFDETQKGISIFAKSDFFSPKEQKDVKNNALITYRTSGANATTEKPSKAGSYEVSVVVKHENYDGGFSLVMKINKANPDFVVPNYVIKLNVGDAIDAGAVVTNVSGEAFYAHFRGKRGTPVSGTFTVKDSVTFLYANLRGFTAVFTPDDGANIESVEVTLYAYVTAAADKAYGIEDVWFDPIVIASYGNYANASMIQPKAEYAGSVYFALENGAMRAHINNGSVMLYGDFRLKLDAVLTDAGVTLLPVYFVPDETVFGEYQIVSFYVTVRVEKKAVVRVGEGENGTVYATVTAGSTYRSAVFSAALSVMGTVSDGVILNPLSNFRALESGGFDLDAVVPASVAGLPQNVRAEYLGGINFMSESDSYPVKFIFNVQEAGILAENLRYEFHLNHALAISISGSNELSIAKYMKISFSGAGDTLPGYSIAVEEMGVPLVNDATYGMLLYDVGVYKVTVTISKNSGYYGARTFYFEIVKRDISDYLTVNGQTSEKPLTKVFLDSISFFAAAYSPSTGSVYDADYILKFREVNSGTFTDSVPVYAGNYFLRVEVDSSDRYAGAKEFSFIIEKKTISISQSALSYVYGNAPAALAPKLDSDVRWGFRFTDNKTGNVISNDYPANVGEYTGTVLVADGNYQGSATFAYKVEAAQANVIWPTYHSIVYGQKLSEAEVNTPGSATVLLRGVVTTAEGRFVFVSENAILNSGNNNVRLQFIPQNGNYATMTGNVNIEVRRAPVTISIVQTDFRYNGEALDLRRIYTIYPVSDIVPTYVIRRGSSGGAIVSRILEVGTYYVEFTVDTVNYYMTASAMVVMQKGAPDIVQNTPPAASDVQFGQLLKKSLLTGGSVNFDGKKIEGTFRFLQEESTASTIGISYYPVEFTPYDTFNYSKYSGYRVAVNVTKAPLDIAVSNTECVYGNIVLLPTFAVNAIGGTTLNFVLEPVFADWIGKVMPARTISTKVTLESEFYYGEQTFVYTVLKKTVGIDFYSDAGRTEKRDTYSSVYGNVFTPFPGINIAELAAGDQSSLSELNQQILVEYRLTDGTITVVPPKNAGENYYVLARYIGQNYNGNAEIRLAVEKATVTEIKVDAATLNKQVYGTVVAPNVTTVPSGVSFTTEFGGAKGLPTEAGSYNLKIIINDVNYLRTEKNFVFVVNPKKVTIENIRVPDKAENGVAALTIEGVIEGLLIGDEVTIVMTAETEGAKSAPGDYNVVITSARLGGRHASNYVFDMPYYSKTVKIFENKVMDGASGSYIVFTNGTMMENVTVEFLNAVSSQNKESFFSTLLGQKAQVINFSIRTDGVKTDLSSPVKVFVEIPERFRNAKNLKVEGLGGLAGAIVPIREGDYFSFITSRSGEIVFTVSDFPYGLIFIGTGVVMLVFGIVAICIFEPIRKKKALMYKMRGKDKK